MIGVSDLPLLPTANLVDPYRIAVARQYFVPEIIIEAMQILPERSLSATFKNLYLLSVMVDVNYPSEDISEYLFKIASLGIRTFSNFNRPLSTPFRPNLLPMSSIKTPLHIVPSSFLTRTKKACTPSF